MLRDEASAGVEDPEFYGLSAEASRLGSAAALNQNEYPTEATNASGPKLTLVVRISPSVFAVR